MSITTVNAKLYISRVIGGGNDPRVQDLAGEALLRGYSDWEIEKDWEFLLKDTSVNTVVAGLSATDSSPTISDSTGLLDFVNPGQTVTVASGSPTLPASTTVLSVTRNSTGVTTSITLTNNFTGTGTVSLSFTADIPLVVGINDYALPSDWSRAYTCRTLVTPRPLTWRRQRVFDRIYFDQTVQGVPMEYTTYNPYSPLTQNYGETRLKFDRVPSQIDNVRLRYYRKFTTNGTNVDMPDDLLYKFLDYCRSVLLDLKRAQDDPSAYRSDQIGSMKQAAQNDEEVTEDNDADNCMKSQWEMGEGARPLWGNGQFDPYRF